MLDSYICSEEAQWQPDINRIKGAFNSGEFCHQLISSKRVLQFMSIHATIITNAADLCLDVCDVPSSTERMEIQEIEINHK